MANEHKSAPLPSTASIRAFEASSRLLSFTDAANELSQTQGAISHQIRDLETRLNQRLFDRLPRGITLTDAGKRYLPYVRDALDRLYEADRIIRSENHDNVLRVSCSPDFAQKWLAPRLGSFISQQPSLDLRISASSQRVDFRKNDIDIAIRHGDGNWPDLAVTALCKESVFPVCSPDMKPTWSSGQSIDDLSNYTLLHDKQREGWSHWLNNIGGVDTTAFKFDLGPVFSQTSLVIDSAVAGQGIALARSALVSLDLKAGRLFRPVAEETPADFGYWIVCSKECESLDKIVLIKEWLLAQTQSA